MKKLHFKKEFILFLFFFYSIVSLGQTNYYYYKGQRTSLTSDGTRIGIATSIKKDSSSIEIKTRSSVTILDFDDAAKANKDKKTFYYEVGTGVDIDIATYNAKDWVVMASPCFLNSDRKKIGLTNNFYVRIGAEGTLDSLYKYAKKLKVEVLGHNKYMPTWFTLSCNKETGFNALEMANQFYETGLFASAEPEFLQMPELHSVNKNKSKDKGLLANNIHSKDSSKDKTVSKFKMVLPNNTNILLKKISKNSLAKSSMVKIPKRTNDSVIDPLYKKQWYLDHTRLPDKFRDTVSITDLGNMIKAWGASQGDDIIVGVFDDGIDGSHIDFKGENYDIHRPPADSLGKVVVGMKEGVPIMGDPPSTVKKGKDYSNIKNAGTRYGIHGTAIAGIIAAVKSPSDTLVSDLTLPKNVGGVGVAPKAKLYSIALPFHTYDKVRHILSNDYDVYTTNQQFADGFGEATENEVQVLNCSWTTNGILSNILDDAISNALYNGRKGKGMVVVFSAGNDDENKIGYPANSNPDILVVGAMSPCGERKRKGPTSCESSGGTWGSNYGPELDVMAFGTDIITTSTVFPPSIYEATLPTDDFITDFEGTSASAAMVSGIAALILKKKPNLTAKQVGIIIQHSSVPEKRRQEYIWGRTTNATGTAVNYIYGLDYQPGNYLLEEGFGLVKADEGLEYSNKFEPRISKAIPAKATISNRTTSSVTCIWPSSLDIGQPYFNGVGYEYFYTKDASKVLSDTETADGFTYTNSLNLKGLNANNNYRFFIRVVGICPLGAVPGQTDRSKWSEAVTFNTDCSVPTELKSSNGLGLTTISWSAKQPNVPSGEGYDYYVSTNGTAPVFTYKEIKADGTKVEADNNTKPTGSVDTPFVLWANLKNLKPNERFEFWVRSKCEKSIWVYGGVQHADMVSPDQTVCYGMKPADISISAPVPVPVTEGFSTVPRDYFGNGNVSDPIPYEVKLPEVLGWQKSIDNTFTIQVKDIPDSANLVLKSDVIGEITETTYFRAVIKDGPVEVYTNPVMISTGGVTIWNEGVWSEGEPNANKTAIIKGNYSENIKDLTACTLIVQGEANVTVPDERVFTVANKVIVEETANLTFKPGSSLMQSGDANINKGNIVFETGRIITNSGKVCVSSPVTDQKISTFPFVVIPDGSTNGYVVPALPNQVNSLDVASGNYLPVDPEINNFILGVGYEIGGNVIAPNTSLVFDGKYHGVPNNGNTDVPVTIDENRAKTFIGNPYPSYIDGYEFLKGNSGVSGLYFRVEDTNPALNTDANSFLTVNLGGSTATTTDSGINIVAVQNPYGSPIVWPYMNMPKPSRFYIGVGVGFFIDVPATAQTLKFTNGMRLSSKDYVADVKNHFSISNKLSSNKAKTTSSPEFNRIWLDMTDDKTSNFSQALVGYMDNASNGFDIGYDTRVLGMNKYALYSLIDNIPNAYTIQGRALPFVDTDIVPLGYIIGTDGNVTINLDSVDGLFSSNSQSVFLEDKTLGVVQDLKLGSYTFNSKAGTFNDRFMLRYTNKTLGLNSFDDLLNTVTLVSKNQQITIKSQIEPIEQIVFYDVLGRKIFVKSNINNNEFSVNELNLGHQTLIVKITLISGQVVTKKLVY